MQAPQARADFRPCAARTLVAVALNSSLGRYEVCATPSRATSARGAASPEFGRRLRKATFFFDWVGMITFFFLARKDIWTGGFRGFPIETDLCGISISISGAFPNLCKRLP